MGDSRVGAEAFEHSLRTGAQPQAGARVAQFDGSPCLDAYSVASPYFIANGLEIASAGDLHFHLPQHIRGGERDIFHRERRLASGGKQKNPGDQTGQETIGLHSVPRI